MKVKKLHNWDVSYSQARALQKELACKVCFKAIPKEPKLVAGLDCAFSRDGRKIVAVAVVLKMPSLEIIETTNAVQDVNFPYISGLLSFREAPVCVEAIKKITNKPDIFIIDGQGIAHPRRLGLASHLGLFIDGPAIGCAKSRLIGKYDELKQAKGNYSELEDKCEIIGAVLRTRTNVKPVFVSVGNKCLLEDAIEIVMACTTKYRLPEPTRQAHKLVSEIRTTIS